MSVFVFKDIESVSLSYIFDIFVEKVLLKFKRKRKVGLGLSAWSEGRVFLEFVGRWWSIGRLSFAVCRCFYLTDFIIASYICRVLLEVFDIY